MAPAENKDAALKRGVTQVFQNCGLAGIVIDREVQINISGDVDKNNNLLSDKEVDVVVRFTYGGRAVLLFFECEDTKNAGGKRKEYKQYTTDLKEITKHSKRLRILASKDNQAKAWHFQDADDIRVCFVYGSNLPDTGIKIVEREAEKEGFIVWSYFALQYYLKISAILGSWTRYEIFKDFSLKLEGKSTTTISAVLAKQNDKRMYVGKIHPGLLLKIAYVVRRASEKTYAYQRMLNRDRINDISRFISSSASDGFLPNAVLIVFDSNAKVQNAIGFNEDKCELTIPLVYCSAWIIDGQHRVYGFLGTEFESWDLDDYKPFDLPVVIFKTLTDIDQTKTFININYNQKRIKSALLCDLHGGRPIGLSSLVQYGLLETLLGFRARTGEYNGPLFAYAPFHKSLPFDQDGNQKAFQKHKDILIRFLDGVKKNTETSDPTTDPWRNTRSYALLKPTGLNALFMFLAKLLELYPGGSVDFNTALKSLKKAKWNRDYVSKKGGGWKGFRALANTLIGNFNRGKSKKNRLKRYGEKEKR
jgi:DGQHR domain-containing protein